MARRASKRHPRATEASPSAGHRAFSRVAPAAAAAGYALLGLIAAIYLAWALLAKADFLYPLWHDLAGLDRTIERYGPQNRYRSGFEQTTKAERVRLFGAIVDAIHDGGEGLEELRYHDARGRELGRLLREPEIVHLQDVARLVDALRIAGWTALGVWLAVVAWRWRVGRSLPRTGPTALAGLGLVAALTAVVLLAGPVRVFYGFHEWLFPPDHQWFFYYQESLLTTMMRAPDLFGYIAAELVALALAIWLAMLGGARGLTRRD